MNTRVRQKRGFPWFREFDQWWYATIKGKPYKLAKGKDNYDAARDEWVKLLALSDAEARADSNPCWVIFERYLAHIEHNHPDRLQDYTYTLQTFKDMFPAMEVKNLRAKDVQAWLKAHPKWGKSSQTLKTNILVAALNWAAKPENQLITRNPIAGIKRPGMKSRGQDAIIPAEIRQQLIKAANRNVKDALSFLNETGTRPINLGRIEAKHVKTDQRCIVLDNHKTKDKTGRPIIIPLTQTALDIVVRLCAKYPEGSLFRGRKGTPYNARVIRRAMQYLLRKLGIKENYTPYGFRHTVATNLLLQDVSPHKVAFLMGHSNTAMLFQHYGHLVAGVADIAQEIDKALNGDTVKVKQP